MIRNEPGSGTDQAVIEADHATDEAGHHVVPVALVTQLGQLTDVGPEGGEKRDGDQRHHDDRFEHARRQVGGQYRTAEAARHRDRRHGHGRAQIRPDTPVEGDRTCGGAEDGSHLVRGQRLDRADARHQQHGRELDESAAADDGVHPARGQTRHDDEDDSTELDRLESRDHSLVRLRTAQRQLLRTALTQKSTALSTATFSALPLRRSLISTTPSTSPRPTARMVGTPTSSASPNFTPGETLGRSS